MSRLAPSAHLSHFLIPEAAVRLCPFLPFRFFCAPSSLFAATARFCALSLVCCSLLTPASVRNLLHIF